jgi:hypothetical protein
MTLWLKYVGLQTYRDGSVKKRVRMHEVTRELPPHAKNVKIVGVHKYPSATLVDIQYEAPQHYRHGYSHLRKRIQTIRLGKSVGVVRLVRR